MIQVSTAFTKINGTVKSHTLPPPELTTAKFPSGIYKAAITESMTGLDISFEEMPRFNMPQKVYGEIESRYSRIMRSFENTTKTLGVLLYGVPGTGKSLLAKYICNNAGEYPVIVVDSSGIKYLENIISHVGSDAIYFIDEFEKMFEYTEDQNFLLSILDGASTRRNMFIFTANDFEQINDFMINRPSRIRYAYEYKSASPEVVREIIREHFDEDQASEIEESVDLINNISYDILQEFIDECKNFPEIAPKELLDGFNVVSISPFLGNYVFDVRVEDKDINELFRGEVSVRFRGFGKLKDVIRTTQRPDSDERWGLLEFKVGKFQEDQQEITFSITSQITEHKVTRSTVSLKTKLGRDITRRLREKLPYEYGDMFDEVFKKLEELPITLVGVHWNSTGAF